MLVCVTLQHPLVFVLMCTPLPHTHPPVLAPTHTGGQWLASGSDDGTMRVWEVATGRCSCSWQLGEPVVCVAWCPDPKLQLLAAAVGNKLVLMPCSVAGDEVEEAGRAACQVRERERKGRGFRHVLFAWERWGFAPCLCAALAITSHILNVTNGSAHSVTRCVAQTYRDGVCNRFPVKSRAVYD